MYGGWGAGGNFVTRYHPESLPEADRPGASFAALSARIRRLEAAISRPAPLPAWPATAPSTSSATEVALWTLPDPGPTDVAVTVTVVGTLTNLAAAASVTLQDANGNTLAQAPVLSAQPIILQAPGPATGPYTVAGATSAGTLTVAMVAASAPRFVADDT